MLDKSLINSYFTIFCCGGILASVPIAVLFSVKRIMGTPLWERTHMAEQFILNIIHCPEVAPEYAEKVTGQGRTEDLGRKALLAESLDIFRLQQEAALIRYIKGKYPMVKCAVATCWEEGPKAYHTCNNSWYTFMDGGPWAPWIPSKVNTHAPAAVRRRISASSPYPISAGI